MKRIWVALMAAVLLAAVLPVAALAEGELTVTQENFMVTNTYSIYGYVFARVENTGDAAIECNGGQLSIYDAEGNTLVEKKYPYVYGKYLKPGEYAYTKLYGKGDVENYTDLAGYTFTLTGKKPSNMMTLKFDCEAVWLPDYPVSKYSTRDYMVATFTNTTENVVYDIQVVMALLDDDNNILDVETVSLYNSTGVNPGSSITVRVSPGTEIRDVHKRDGLNPTHIDAYAYVEIEED